MSVEVVWSPRAWARLREIQTFVAKDKPDAAERLAIRIASVVEALRDHPYLGHAAIEPGVRELVIGGTPYVVVYRLRRGLITITTIWHGAQSRRPPS